MEQIYNTNKVGELSAIGSILRGFKYKNIVVRLKSKDPRDFGAARIKKKD